MRSFRTELENPIVDKDIVELERKIRLYKEGSIDEESFRSLRLARGVYGQRQSGVQMVRIKLPLGIVTPLQLERIAAISDKYSNGNLHFTTRQDVQIHYVSLDDTPQLWEELEQDSITLREACGNTVRNITASPLAGVDKEEPFDVTPHGWTLFNYLLRNPIGQEMGRKFKIALSSSDRDSARAYMHDLGLIPKIENGVKGFKVVIGGGLGAQPANAQVAYEFLPEQKLIGFVTALIKVFDQFGERNRRNKARFKFLLQQEGLDNILQKVQDEILIDAVDFNEFIGPAYENTITTKKIEAPVDKANYFNWLTTNVVEQNDGKNAVFVKIRNGNIDSERARILAEIIRQYSLEPARITIDQNIVIRSVPKDLTPNVYNLLNTLNLSEYGAESIADITACPGTETCNLGITATYKASDAIEAFLLQEYESLILKEKLSIKMSGCMNSCGQHSVADIGFHGSTIRSGDSVFPAFQILLGGSNLGNGHATIADKVIKVPSKRVLDAIRIILDDYTLNKKENHDFAHYYQEKGKIYFYDLLKSVADVTSFESSELLDWGMEDKFKPEIGVGECAGVKIDLVQTLLFEAQEKIDEADYFLQKGQLKDAVYTSYSVMIQTAKAYLVKKGEKTNSKHQITQVFEQYILEMGAIENSFSEYVNYQFDTSSEVLTTSYLQKAKELFKNIKKLIQ